MDYRDSGINIGADYTSVELMEQYVGRTLRSEVVGGIGGLSRASSPAGVKSTEDPVLLSGADGVGIKLKIAFLLSRHDTIGIDCVAMCMNDVAYADGEPLFFLDYIACGKSVPGKITMIISGVAEGCVQTSCALVDGGTTEHPGLMPKGEYDLAGFSVGACDRKDLIAGGELKPDDVLIGITSSGVHSSGFPLVRNIFEVNRESLTRLYPELDATLDEALLAPTRIYVKALESAKKAGVRIHACSHITSGGFYENVSHMPKDGARARIRKDSYEVPAIFRLMAKKSKINKHVMYNAFNMGAGMVAAADLADIKRTIEVFQAADGESFVIGECKAGEEDVNLC